jgi:hypothetical protein
MRSYKQELGTVLNVWENIEIVINTLSETLNIIIIIIIIIILYYL